MKSIILPNGVKMPCCGFGTYKLTEEEAYKAVKEAIKLGYRYIDSAYAYMNEKGTGRAIKECIDEGIVQRSDLFVVTKIREQQDLGYYNALKSFEESLENLQLDYVDLVLIHTPFMGHPDWKRLCIDTWCALEKLYQEGKAKALGVSNYKMEHLDYLLKYSTIKPMLDQIELHPFCQQKELVAYCRDHNITPTSWSSLNQGGLPGHEWIPAMEKKYNKTIAQIMLRWSLQKGYVPLSRSKNPKHMAENLDVFDFILDEGDMHRLDLLETTRNRYDETVFLPKKPKPIPTKHKWYLFGFIPILTTKGDVYRKMFYIFGIPVLKIKA